MLYRRFDGKPLDYDLNKNTQTCRPSQERERIYLVFLRAKDFYEANDEVGGVNSSKWVSRINRACWEGADSKISDDSTTGTKRHSPASVEVKTSFGIQFGSLRKPAESGKGPTVIL